MTKLDPTARLSGEWVATEKVHGANLAILHDGNAIQAAKRKGILGPKDFGSTFFGLISIWPDLHNKALTLYEKIEKPYILYGELAGGVYPGFESPKDIRAVQGGIYYSPNLEYLAFDLYFPDEDLWISDRNLRETLADIFDVVPLLGYGKYQKLMQLPIKYKTHVPRLLGIDAAPDNFAEGFILKPNENLKTNDRIVIKQKRNAFNETLPFAERVPINDHLSRVVYLATQKITPARVWSARSKAGTDPEAILSETFEDIFTEMIFENVYLSESDCKEIIERLTPAVLDLL